MCSSDLSRYRRYRANDVRRLVFVRRARELGFGLDEVRTLLTLTPGGQEACAEARALAATHRADVQAKISDLKAMERALTQAIRRCDAGEVMGCPLIEVLSTDPASA